MLIQPCHSKIYRLIQFFVYSNYGETVMRKLYLSSFFLIASQTGFAAPNDLFLQARELKSHSQDLKINVAVDAVNETIDVLNLRDSSGSNSSENTGDYFGGHISAEYKFSPNLKAEVEYWERQIDVASDTNTINSWLVGTTYYPELHLAKKDQIALRASAWGNFSDELNKNSPTSVNGRTFNRFSVTNPNDIQFQLDGIFSRKLDFMNQLNAFASLGYSKVSVESLKAQARLQGCSINLDIDSSNQYQGELASPCTVGNATINQLEVSGNASEFGINVQDDLNYDAYFTNIGGSWNWRYQKFESQWGYQYQRLWRNNVDDRVSRFGSQAVKDNHTIAVKVSYDYSPKITPFFEAQYFVRNFVGTIPFIYNGVTASRLDQAYGLATLGVQFRGF